MTEEVTDISEDQNQPEVQPEPLDPNVIKAEITEEMQSAYLDYAMSVIVSRALPDVRDGLKPVQRRIIYAMQDNNMDASGKFHKCAAVVGEVLKKYHPHGDVAVYDALVRMGQNFSLRYPLIWGQGNFGSIDGDPPAAMRYTECKLQAITAEIFTDIDKDTVNFEINDLQNPEPIFMPSLLPNVLLNGAVGIAVGMATNIPPHNLNEVVDGINLLIEKADDIGQAPAKEDSREIAIFDGGEGDEKIKVKVSKPGFSSQATVEDLVQHIQGPDFPTGGIIYDQKEIMQMYATGKGRVITRAKTDIETTKSEKSVIIVTEIPYQVNKSTLLEKVASLIKNKKINGISDIRDESDRRGMRIVIELKKEAIPQKVQNQLFKYTQLQDTFNANLVMLVNGEPKLLTLKMILEEFVKHRQQVVIRRALFLLKRAREREHILLGLKKALDNLDAVIDLIKKSADADKAKEGLMQKFDLTERQAQAILDMQLRRLAALERKKIEDELMEIVETIKDHEGLLASPQKIMSMVQKELGKLKEKYGDERRTKFVKGKIGKLVEEDLIQNTQCIVTISENGYIKRLDKDTYKKQSRGGKGVKGQQLKEEDEITTIRACETHDWALFFTNKGRVYKMRVWEIPESTRTAKGTALVNFLSMGQEEKVHAFLTIKPKLFEAEGGGFIVFGTEQGMVKKTPITEYENIRSTGIIAINLADDDYLAWVRTTSGKDQVMLITAQGQSIRFEEGDVRPMGRLAGGVRGIKLKSPRPAKSSKGREEDYVVGMAMVSKDKEKIDLIVVSENGYGKRSSLDEYKVQNRGGSGIKTYNVTVKTGKLVVGQAKKQKAESDLLMSTAAGHVIRLPKNQVPILGRATMGVRLIKLGAGDHVASVAFLDEETEENKD